MSEAPSFLIGKIKVEILDDSTIRLQKESGGGFLDENTFFIPRRGAYKGPKEKVESKKEGDRLSIYWGNRELRIPLKADSYKEIELWLKGEKAYEYAYKENVSDLGRPGLTPQVYQVTDGPRIIVPSHGYRADSTSSSTSDYAIDPSYDVYLLIPEGDPLLLRRLYVALTGRIPLLRLANLGAWDSRYYAYSEESAKEELDRYDELDLPLDNFVIDTDWRSSYVVGGAGYEVNKELFPDMEGFLSLVHRRGIEVMFNDHPEPVKGTTSVLSPSEVEYRRKNLQALLKIGVDTWWYDRNWSVALLAPEGTFDKETWGAYLYTDVTKAFYKDNACAGAFPRRGVVMSNVDNVVNGKWIGIDNTASHRYPFQWTGDTFCQPECLRQEVANIVKGGYEGIAYINSDIGGHNGDVSPELYIRWVQYGALSPIFRPHSTNSPLQKYRQPWLYGEKAIGIFRDYLKMRYRLIPYLYALSFEAYVDGLPLIRALDFHYPKDPKAYRDDEYLIGKSLLFAPITEEGGGLVKRKLYLPKGRWMNLFTGVVYAGGASHVVECDLRSSPLFVKLGSMIPLIGYANRTKRQNWDHLCLDYYPGEEDCHGFIYEDDGETIAYEQGHHRLTAYSASFLKRENTHVLKVFKAEDGLRDGKDERRFTFRVHLIDGFESLSSITLNGEKVPFLIQKKDGSSFALNFEGPSPDSDVCHIEANIPFNQEAELRLLFGE